MKKIILIFISIISFCLLINNTPVTKTEAVKGMTISCQTWGWEWGSDEIVEAMFELKQMWVNWIAIHPYARIHSDGTVDGFRSRGEESYVWLTRPIQEAHRLGMKICIKPHLAYWGTKFKWRGDIEFDNEQQWDNFFNSYEKWMASLAAICKDADAFVIGTELDKTIGYEDQWREIIRKVRYTADVPMTYAANWSEYDKVKFWDELDVIGIQAYFPLADSSGDLEIEQIVEGWDKHLKKLKSFSKKWNKPVVFTELGYDLSFNAAYRPWESGRKIKAAEPLQKKCLDTALRSIENNDQIIGAFLCKWFAGNSRGENFLKSTPAMRKIIESHWAFNKDF